MIFGITALKVLVMIAYGVPGFILVKTKMLGEDAIKYFSKFLLYVCQPCLAINSFASVERSAETFKEIGIFFILTLAGEIIVMLVFCLVFKPKMREAAYRVCAVAGACGNVGFLGIPLLEKLLPEYPRVVIFSATFSCSMNILAWTLGLLLMTGDKKYIRPKQIFVNPAMIATGIGLIIFGSGIKLPEILMDYIGTVGKMSTVLCMTVLGMRLALTKFRVIFGNLPVLFAAVSKLLVFPAIVTALFALFPSVSFEVRAAALILSSCPAASMIQGLSEIKNGDSATASSVVLATNILCILTVPLMWTAFNAIFA